MRYRLLGIIKQIKIKSTYKLTTLDINLERKHMKLYSFSGSKPSKTDYVQLSFNKQFPVHNQDSEQNLL